MQAEMQAEVSHHHHHHHPSSSSGRLRSHQLQQLQVCRAAAG
jgi:hypothetical protein